MSKYDEEITYWVVLGQHPCLWNIWPESFHAIVYYQRHVLYSLCWEIVPLYFVWVWEGISLGGEFVTVGWTFHSLPGSVFRALLHVVALSPRILASTLARTCQASGCRRRLTGSTCLAFLAFASWLLGAERDSQTCRGHFCFPCDITSTRMVSFAKNSSTWLVVRTICMCK